LLLQLVELPDLLRARLAVSLGDGHFLRRGRLLLLRGRRRDRDGERKEKRLHSSDSCLSRTMLPSTVGRPSILRIAWFTSRSSARCVSITMSTCCSPSAGSFCTIASIEMRQ